MNQLYSSPLRVYLLLGALALAGIFSGFKLPISLFPNSSKPDVWVNISFGSMTADEFLNTHGKRLESQLRNITADKIEVETIDAQYGGGSATYNLHFKWGVQPNAALKEVQTIVNAFAARLPEESRDSVQVDLSNENSGFFALSLYSDSRDLDSLYEYLEPILGPRITHVRDAQNPVLYNPSSKEVRIELIPETMASLQLFPRDIDDAVATAMGGRAGGSLTVGMQQLSIELPRQMNTVEQLAQVSVPTPSGKAVHLGDIAHINLGQKTGDTQAFKTNGSPSLILYAAPKPGGNVKRMSEDLLGIVEELAPGWPKDIHFRKLVDPSEFIRSSIQNVFREVGIAALLAVFVLFLFIGSFRNVVTAAIEIPLSMVLAFILMRLSGMNLNLISLGGLALSAGMNVDASVVVMENIFRHFEAEPGPHDFAARLRIVVQAVREVRFAVIASTIASLVVFIPLTFTSDLSYAILGDLALAVVFSHGFSAFVALLLVPTVRLQLMSLSSGGDVGTAHSPIEKYLKGLEHLYGRALGAFVARPRLKWGAYSGLALLLICLAVFVIPRLRREIVGIPDTDWMVIGVNSGGNTMVRQMEMQLEEVERDLLTEYGPRIQYTFSIVRGPNSASIMARLSEKSHMREVWKAMEKHFANTPTLFFFVAPWNPSELPIPDPPDLKVAVRGGTLRDRAWTAKEISDLLQEKRVFPRIDTKPTMDMGDAVRIEPHVEQWTALRSSGSRIVTSDLADLVRVATQGRRTAYFPYRDRQIDIILRYPQGYLVNVEDIGALPVGVGAKIVPLKALAEIHSREATQSIYREDEREVILVRGRSNQGEEDKNAAPNVREAKSLIADWESKRAKPKPGQTLPSVTFEDAAKDLNDAIRQLTYAVALSIVLIFLVLLLQFGSFIEPLLVLTSIPLGFIGVLVSLWVFKSPLSLNSILGVILLNGIAVANSIILVDFIKRLVAEGKAPRAAAVEAAQKRLRPILITSLTTVLGMLPVAIGAGEGGRILQPLGIAVSGGLWVSMGLTLFLVPALQVSYLEWRLAHRAHPGRKFFTRGKWAKAVLLFTLLSPAAFGDGAPLSFTEAIRRIVDRHVGVQGEQAKLAGVQGKNLSAHYALLPTISLSGTQDYTPDRQQSAQAVGNLNIFRFGADVSGMHAASREEEAQNLAVEEAVLSAQGDAVTALVAVISANLELVTQDKILKMYGDSLDIAQRRFKRGILATQEVDKILVDLDNAQAQRRDTEAALVKARAGLQSLLGNDQVELDWAWKDAAAQSNLLKAVPLTDLALRPDWRSAEKKFSGADYRVSQSAGLALPSLDANVVYGYGEFIGRPATPGLPPVQGWQGGWNANVTLTIPLFDRFDSLGKYRVSVADRKAAEIELEKTKRGARAEYETARGSLEISLKTAVARDKTLGISRRLYDDNLQRFRQGLASANDISVDQERLYRSEIFAIRGWAAVHTNFAALCNALGRRVEQCL